MPDYSWPPMDKRRVMGKRLNRLDGIVKSTGAAKYNSDFLPDGLLHAVLLTCPYAHAKVKSIDTGAAEKLPGVTKVRVISAPGTELNWAGAEVAVVAASTEEAARDAVRLMYELKYQADALLNTPSPLEPGRTLGPAFEYLTNQNDPLR